MITYIFILSYKFFSEGFGQLLRIFEKIDEHRGGAIPENLLQTLQNEFDIVQYHLQQGKLSTHE